MSDSVEGVSNPILRSDHDAVSPVIATILLVAITVVLAAVLYVMVSDLFNRHATTSDFLGVSSGQSGNGIDWVLTFVSVPNSVNQNLTFFTLTAANGSTVFTGKTLFQLERATSGVQYSPANWGAVNLAPNDRLLISVTAYPRGTGFSFSTPGTVLATGTLG